jgi:hypothetical protein
MALYQLKRDFFDGTQRHDAGAVLDFPEGSTPPSTAVPYTGRPQPAGTVGVASPAAPTPSVALGSPPPAHPDVAPPTGELPRPEGVSQDEPGLFQPGKEPVRAPSLEEQGPIRGVDEGAKKELPSETAGKAEEKRAAAKNAPDVDELFSSKKK